MGAGSSILGADGEWGETSLGDMPESCVAAVLLYLDPPEICQVARLNRAFRGAASADCVWAGKLPANYRYLAALAAAADDESRGDGDANGKPFSLAATKKEIYALLCRPTAFDESRKEFWIEKNKGGLCMCISSKAMTITGIDDRRYWSHLATEESRRSIVLPIFNKFGGLRWMGSLSSAFLLALIAFSSIFTWADPIGAWVVGFVELSTYTGGMSRPHGSSSQHPMNSRRHQNITYRSKDAGNFTMLVISSYQTPTSPSNLSSQ
ncbi:hypothetical protein ACP70R_027583 [Stipagrostis hirtigluma subsp. patula]